MKIRLLIFFIVVTSAKVSYKGHQVWRLTIQNEEDPNVIYAIATEVNLDIWEKTNQWVDVMVSPTQQTELWPELTEKDIEFKITISDVGVYLGEDLAESTETKEFALDSYNTFSNIESYLHGVAANNTLAKLESIGQGIEDRYLWLISFARDRSLGKEAVWIDCGIHAREWITVSTCLYGIDQFDREADANITALLDRYDIYFLPVVNPDGYDFTWTTDRLWRKNRNQNYSSTCPGVDLNRNFDDHFGGNGTSSDPCSINYAGPSPASEPETIAIQTKLHDLRASNKLNNLYSIHSYSQCWMWPYGYNYELSPDDDEQRRVGNIGVDALTAVYGTQFESGTISTTGGVYSISGNTPDYAYAQVGIRYSYLLELRPNVTATGGFELPPSEITPTAVETWAGLKAALFAAIPAE